MKIGMQVSNSAPLRSSAFSCQFKSCFLVFALSWTYLERLKSVKERVLKYLSSKAAKSKTSDPTWYSQWSNPCVPNSSHLQDPKKAWTWAHRMHRMHRSFERVETWTFAVSMYNELTMNLQLAIAFTHLDASRFWIFLDLDASSMSAIACLRVCKLPTARKRWQRSKWLLSWSWRRNSSRVSCAFK